MVKTKLKPTALYFGHDGTESGLYELRLNYGAPTRSLPKPAPKPVAQAAATRGADSASTRVNGSVAGGACRDLRAVGRSLSRGSSLQGAGRLPCQFRQSGFKEEERVDRVLQRELLQPGGERV